MDDILKELRQTADRIILHLKDDLTSIRTGRISPALVENFIVETYQGQSKLRLLELASILVADAQTLKINPYDAATAKDIERSILKSPLGLNPMTKGNQILISFPPLSQEQRQKILKVINQKIEEKKTMLRNTRDNIRKKIKNMLEAKSISENDKFRMEKEIDKVTQEFNGIFQQIKDKKEKEVMEI